MLLFSLQQLFFHPLPNTPKKNMKFTLLFNLLLILDTLAFNGKIESEASGKHVVISCGGGFKIHITSAEYGSNCGTPLDELDHLGAVCDDVSYCRYPVRQNVIGDPAIGCGKDYVYSYQCVQGGVCGRIEAPASGKRFTISCGINGQINIIKAYYGKNCDGINVGQTWKVNYQTGNLGAACDGYDACTYNIEANEIGDMAPGCGKNYNYEYECV
eukprot:199881_1